MAYEYLSPDLNRHDLNIKYDVSNDIVTICGMRYAGCLFRNFSLSEPGAWLRIQERIQERKDGVITVYGPSEEMCRTIDIIAGRSVASFPK